MRNNKGTETMLNADELPNGVYLYTIETDGTAAQPQRLVIIK